MANRVTYPNPSGQKGTINISGSFQIAPTSNAIVNLTGDAATGSGPGQGVSGFVKSITRTSTGVYVIHLADLYTRLLFFAVNIMTAAATPLDGMQTAETVAGVSGLPGSITFTVVNTTSGTATDLTDNVTDTTARCQFFAILKNSSV